MLRWPIHLQKCVASNYRWIFQGHNIQEGKKIQSRKKACIFLCDCTNCCCDLLVLLRLHACMKVLAGTLLADLLAADRVYRALAEKVQGHFWRLVWLQSRAHDRDHHSARNCESKHSNLLLYYSLTSFVNINVMQNFHLSTFENTRMKLIISNLYKLYLQLCYNSLNNWRPILQILTFPLPVEYVAVWCQLYLFSYLPEGGRKHQPASASEI